RKTVRTFQGTAGKVYKINDLLIKEFDWKKLGTFKNLVACGLLPKGAAFPAPTVRSSRPLSSKKKKPRKQTDKSASSSKPRKRKATVIPSTSEPSSLEIASPLAPHQQEERWLLVATCEHHLPLSGPWQNPRHSKALLHRHRKGKRRSTLPKNEKSPSRISRQARLLHSLKQ
ncbi:hypothetical protein PanWU01x14_146110, partial [Parasponia andersonii]